MPDNRAPGNNPTSNSAPGFAERPDYRIEIAPTEKRVRVQFAGETVADSTRALLLLEQGHTPVSYFPRDDESTQLRSSAVRGGGKECCCTVRSRVTRQTYKKN